jgi:Transcriptional regulator of RNA polII, SAGA, subunit
VQLHNALIVSIFDPSTHLVTALTPPPDVPKGPPRKRRRLLPYQGPDPDEPITLRSSRLKRWAVGIGRRERDRIRNLKPVALTSKRVPRPEVDEIANERGVRLLPERGGECFVNSPQEWSLISSPELPGSRPAIQLASSARGFILQHITERLNLICAQHHLNLVSKNVASLMSLAFEVRA